jgi:Ca2+-transporting ATPase
MKLSPRPRGESVLTRPTMLTSGLVGLAMATANLALIEVGKNEYGSVAVGSSIGLTAFVLMLVVAAYECRSETGTVFTLDTFDSTQMNLTATAEIAGAILVTQWDFLARLLGTTQLTAQQFGLALLAALVLLGVWELGKWGARRTPVHDPNAPAQPVTA